MDRKVYFPSSQEKQSREERGGGSSTVQSNRKPIRSLSPLSSSPIPNMPRKPCNSKMRGFLARGLGFYLVSDLDAFMVF
ncbi:Os05g0554601 [Oryza sativa Japonica Group]|uniref:Os05g0554601 protein n=4 Tax=Oryza TaxID=4527 RepID=C7J283_ORYSJ|nr:Os05g0554601 [Oryza sativa Japonica Group]|eukprot:NP_001174518.1 Os05g0554601 [Oryza sativa Japonica Group]